MSGCSISGRHFGSHLAGPCSRAHRKERTMTKSIAAIFATQDDGHAAVQDLLDQHIAADRIRMIAGNRPERADEANQAGTDEATGAVAAGGAVGLAGLSSLVLPGIGTLLAAGT